MQVCDVVLATGDEIINTNDCVVIAEHSFAKMRANKTGAPGDQYSHTVTSSGTGVCAGAASAVSEEVVVSTNLVTVMPRCLLDARLR